MAITAIFGLALALLTVQADDRPPYAREGDRIEQEFLAQRDRLTAFYAMLRDLVGQQPAATAAALPPLQPQDAPPAAGARFGYGVLPKIVDAAKNPAPPVSVFSYSWPITEGYIAGEGVKLGRAEESLQQAATAPEETKTKIISSLITEYRTLLTNHRTIDQYIQYNQFWQRSISQDRSRFDQLTKVYQLMKSDEPDITQAIREVLGKPEGRRLSKSIERRRTKSWFASRCTRISRTRNLSCRQSEQSRTCGRSRTAILHMSWKSNFGRCAPPCAAGRPRRCPDHCIPIPAGWGGPHHRGSNDPQPCRPLHRAGAWRPFEAHSRS